MRADARQRTAGSASTTPSSASPGCKTLAGAPAARPDRHAAGLVARQDLLGLPVNAARATLTPLMGRRSRKQRRLRAVARARRAAGRPRRAPRRAAAERPRAPWHPFPLVELCVLVGLVLIVWGLIRGGRRAARVHARLRARARLARGPGHRAARALRGATPRTRCCSPACPRSTAGGVWLLRAMRRGLVVPSPAAPCLAAGVRRAAACLPVAAASLRARWRASRSACSSAGCTT